MSRAKPKAAPKPDDGALDAKQPTLEGEWVPVDSLHLDPANVRRHPERNLDAIKASLARFGQQKPIVVDADGIVRAGNGTLEAARALGWPRVGIVRTHLRGAEATAYAIADNRTAELAEWAGADLAAALEGLEGEGIPMGMLGFTQADLDEILEAVPTEPGSSWEPEGKGDGLALIREVVRAEPTAKVKRGDVVELGRHVLICADVLREWSLYLSHLSEGDILAPYPSPFLPLADCPARLVLVQPDEYLASVTVDLHAAAGHLAGVA
jgi:hypothetical protein